MELSACLYFTNAVPPGKLFADIAEAFSQRYPGSCRFGYFYAEPENGRNIYPPARGGWEGVGLEKVLQAAHGLNDPGYRLSSEAIYQCWQEDGEWAEASAYVYVDGMDQLKKYSLDPRVDGQAQIEFDRFLYNEVFEHEDPRHEELNQFVDKNLIALSNFLLDLAVQSGASSMKIYRDDILSIPINASFAYYRDTQALQDDLRFIDEIWERGLPEHKLGPLKDCPPDVLKKYVRPRDEAWKSRMLGELNRLLPIQDMPTAEDLRAVLDSKLHDNYEVNEGFAILDYPFYMNSMLEPFYIDLLKQARGMKLDSPDD